MPIMIFTMLVIVVLAVVIIAVVAIGLEGNARERNPELAEVMETTARHLNGDAEPPRAVRAIFDEIEEVPELNVRVLPAKLRRSASSARSAASADTPEPATPRHADTVRATPARALVESGPADEASDGGVPQRALPAEGSTEAVLAVDDDIDIADAVAALRRERLRESVAASLTSSGDTDDADDPYGLTPWTVASSDGARRA